MEVWKNIEETNGIYQVSNKGRVKRVGIYKNQFTSWHNEYILKPAIHERGYLFVQLSVDGKILRRYIHRLVAQAFIPNIDKKATVNHKNGDKTNNCVENLEWCTYLENNVHAYQYLGKTQRNKRGSKPVLQFDLSNNFIKEYPSVRKAIRQTGITSIDKACKKKQNRKQAGGFKWKYKEEKI